MGNYFLSIFYTLAGAIDLWLAIDNFLNKQYGVCALFVMLTLFMTANMVIYLVKSMFNLR